MQWQAGGERTRKPSKMTLTEFLYADDAVAVGSTTASMERAALTLEEVVLERGLMVKIPKTKVLVAGRDETDVQPICIGEVIKAVTNFRYLGSIIEASGDIKMKVEPLGSCVGLFVEMKTSL